MRGVNMTITHRPPAQLTPTHSDPLCLALAQFQVDHNVFAPGTSVVVGVSGGADSVCLLHLLARHAPEWQLTLHVAHLDHGLRPDSAADAEFVAALAADWGLTLHQRRLLPGVLPRNEDAARRARYTFLADVAAETGATVVAVAHHAGDQAETLLLHLLRGSGLAGLAAMRPVQPLPQDVPADVRLARPLLGVQRTQILRYLHAHALPYRQDPTNVDTSYTRNWLRHSLLPHIAERFPAAEDALTRAAAILADEADRADAANRAAFATLLHPTEECDDPPSRTTLDRRGLVSRDAATQRGVVRCAWAALTGPTDALTFDLVEQVRHTAASAQTNAGPAPLAAGISLTVADNQLILHRGDVRPDHPFLARDWAARGCPVPGVLDTGNWLLRAEILDRARIHPSSWQNNADAWTAYFDADVAGEIRLSTPQPGTRFAPLGLGGRHKQVGDLFTDQKVAPLWRSGWPLILRTDGEILWVCGVQPGHMARVTAQTQTILRLSWEVSQK
ncbi:tRNA lysidine(34) synthetase TilS [bacterium]|nr:tRNA lysidine(34) synthetase TilS [bacterium]